MPNFQYIARNAAGEEIAGSLAADNEAGVIRSLDERQLFPVRVWPAKEARQGLKGGGRIRLRDVGVFYSQLADLLRAGVPLLRSLDTLVRACANRRLSAVIADVKGQVAEGKSLTEAMAMHGEVFNTLHTAMVRAGERGGFLEDVLVNLATYLDRVDELRSKVRGAMIYPLVLTVIGSLAVLGVLVILVPKFQPIFAKIALPMPTRILFAASSVLINQWPAVIGVTMLLVIGVVAALRSDLGKRLWDRWQIRLPIAGALIRSVCVSRFCRILGTMLANGVPILQALTISKDAAGSIVLAESIENAAQSVRGGQKLATPLEAGNLFGPEVVEMIAVAEESNQLEKVLLQIADNVERRANRQVDAMVRLIEPLVLVLFATIIGFVAVGLLYPIFTMSQTLK